MIVEQRTYLYHPGGLPKFFKAYEESGVRELQQRILGNLIGYFTSEIGMLNQPVHLWGYASLDDRAAGLERVFGRNRPALQNQESKILLPTSFSPIGGSDPGGI